MHIRLGVCWGRPQGPFLGRGERSQKPCVWVVDIHGSKCTDVAMDWRIPRAHVEGVEEGDMKAHF